jgi:hypothetical protein
MSLRREACKSAGLELDRAGTAVVAHDEASGVRSPDLANRSLRAVVEVPCSKACGI